MRYAPELFQSITAQETGALLHSIWKGMQSAGWTSGGAEAAAQSGAEYKKAVKGVLAKRINQIGHAYGHFIGA